MWGECMKLFGRDITFLRTVGGNIKIADLCPDHDMDKIQHLFDGSYQKSQLSCAKFICILAEGAEQNKMFSDPKYQPFMLTEEMVLSLPDETFNALFNEALEAYAGERPTIETAPEKGKKKAVQKSN